jgi:quercetin dioxygenase-like cupin family protein
MGQKYLASGKSLSMRLWEETPTDRKSPSTRPYETVGYVIKGSADLILEGQRLNLREGDSWLVPAGAEHHYEIRSDFQAVEATSPPAFVESRDHP